MADNTFEGTTAEGTTAEGTTAEGPQGAQPQDVTDPSVRLVRGHASPEELAALVAILAVASGDDDPDGDDGPSAIGGRHARSQWNLPERMVRPSYPHGPAGWRASALPR